MTQALVEATFDGRHEVRRVRRPDGTAVGQKFAKSAANEATLVHELRVRAALQAQDVPLPRLDGTGSLQWLWSPSRGGGGWDLAAWSEVGEALRKAHNGLANAARSGLALPYKRPGSWTLEANLVARGEADLARRLAPVFAQLPELEPAWNVRLPCHGDFHAENVLVGPACILDWEFASLGDPAVDAGMLLGEHLALGGGAEAVGAFLRGYGADPAFARRARRHAAFEAAMRAYLRRGEPASLELAALACSLAEGAATEGWPVG